MMLACIEGDGEWFMIINNKIPRLIAMKTTELQN